MMMMMMMMTMMMMNNLYTVNLKQICGDNFVFNSKIILYILYISG